MKHESPINHRRGAGVIYISYDGMLEPLGQSQVLAYLEKLAADRPIHLLSFEKAEDWARNDERATIAARMKSAGIRWHARRYHKRPSSLATAWDIGVGTLTVLWLVLRHRIAIVHVRSYVAGVMGLAVTRVSSAKLLFDMRGFWADGGLWPRDGRMFRIAKGVERRLLLGADHVVSLTQAGVREMEKFAYLRERMPPMTVIPTCADLTRFRPLGKAPSEDFVLGYVGSAGTWYLFDKVAACFNQLLKIRPNARLLVINRGEHAYIRERLASAGVSEAAFELKSAIHDEVPREMARMYAAVFFIKPVFSKQASAPTKLGEFLGCGIPCLSNTGVGDMAAILEGEQVGVAVDTFDAATLMIAIEKLMAMAASSETAARCVAAAQRHFSLEEGVARYAAIYRQLEAIE
jgi:glycosyltransferase involved in cell wall biosynthesis